MKTKLFLTGLALVVVTIFASAQNSAGGKESCNSSCNGTNKCAAFIDTNKNGICDTYENRTTNNQDGKASTNGQSNSAGQGICKGKNACDANQKGVCNNSGSCLKK